MPGMGKLLPSPLRSDMQRLRTRRLMGPTVRYNDLHTAMPEATAPTDPTAQSSAGRTRGDETKEKKRSVSCDLGINTYGSASHHPSFPN